jgi:hypothetical protein
VTLDAKGAVRFNRMDQVFGAICRNIEIPSAPRLRGIRPFFDFIVESIERSKKRTRRTYWHDLTNEWQWDYSDATDAPAMFVAIRAWGTGNSTVHDTVEDWLFNLGCIIANARSSTQR